MSFPFLKSSTPKPGEVWAWAKQLVTMLNRTVTDGSAIPPGVSTIWHSGVDAPTGWLKEDGTSYAVADYPVLFNIIGYSYGGAGANFNVRNSGADTIVKV